MRTTSASVLLLALALLGPASLPAAAAPQASARPGLGATPYGPGTTFRVWAPHADRVFVAGDWNGMSDDRDELAREPGGQFSADIPGALPGQAYRFVIHHGADLLRHADPRARQMRASNGASVIVDPAAYRWKTAAFTPAGLGHQVVYEMHVGTFNPKTRGRPGTFASAAERLDDLRDLGVNMVELMPPAEFPGDFSWGYNPSEPFAPESAYGAPDDLRAFVDAAHARGIGVIVDVVHNHWGPADLPMWRFDGEALGPKAGGVYFYPDARGQTPWGPRPDYGRPEVRQYIQDCSRMWLDEYRMDGMRWDSVVNIRNAGALPNGSGWALLRAVNDAAHAGSSPKTMIAEDLQNDGSVTQPTGAGGAGFDAQWDAGFFHPVERNIIAASDRDRSMAEVRDAIAHGYGHATERVVYTESHDEVANGRQRVPQMISPRDPGGLAARKRSTLGAAIVMTSPGVPMILQGQEVLEDGWFADDRPVDWSKAQRFAGIRALYRDLIALRVDAAGTTRGLTGDGLAVYHVNEAAKVIAFHRWRDGGPGDDVVVLANFSGRAFAAYDLGFPRDGKWRVRLNSDARRYSADFGDAPAFDVDARKGRGTIALGPYAVVILSQ